jgi:hypothetical protein
MSDKRLFHSESIGAGANNNYDFTPFTIGERVFIENFGALDRALDASGKGSAFILQWGSGGSFTEMGAIALVGNTFVAEIKKELIGDGIKFLRVRQFNDSTTGKQVMWWLKGKTVN